jgi:hypothetical protein
MYFYLKCLRRWRHLCLLTVLFAFLVVEPIASSLGIMFSQFDVLFILVMMVLLLILSQGKIWWIIALLFTVPAAVLLIAGRVLPSPAADLSLYCSQGLGAAFFIVVACKIVVAVSKSEALSLDSIFGTICGYLLLGVAWGLTYATMDAVAPQSFHVADSHRAEMTEPYYSRNLFIYYSFVTLTTVGYGDVVPMSIPARTLSWVEAVAGQMYLAILIAGLVGALVAKNRSQDRSRR